MVEDTAIKILNIAENEILKSERRSILISYMTIISCMTALLVLGFIITRSINASLKHAIHSLTKSGDQVASSSTQVASSSQSLADASSQQAASIEETSSSLEEMSNMQ